jgi:hypothetical protein
MPAIPSKANRNLGVPSALPPARSIGQALVYGMLAILIDAGIAWYVFEAWKIECARDVRTPAPTGLTSALCLLGTAFLCILERRRSLPIAITGFIGFLIGWGLCPATSTGSRGLFPLVQSGAWRCFTPFGICFGSCIGTLIGQNLTALRRLINSVNAASPIIGAQAANEGLEESQGQPPGERA